MKKSENKKCPNLCNQVAELPCSCCGLDNHHQNCSACDCEKWWETREKCRLASIKQWNENKNKNPKKEMEEELVQTKNYWEKFKDDPRLLPDMKESVLGYISFLEQRIPKQKNQAEWEQHCQNELKQYEIQTYYSQPGYRPPNTNCPHWRKYALNEDNQQPSTLPTNPQPSNKENPSSFSPSLKTIKPGVIVLIVAIAVSFASLVGYLIWNKDKNRYLFNQR